MSKKALAAFVCVVLLAAWAGMQAQGVWAQQPEDGRVFELRTYHLNEGKLELLHARFRDHTDRLFKRHGIEPIGYWVTTDDEPGQEKVVFLLAHESREAATQSWQAFREDPEWVEARAASEVDGVLVERAEVVFLRGMDYSPLR